MKNVKDLGPNEGIVITSKKEAKKIVKLFQAAGLKPASGKEYSGAWMAEAYGYQCVFIPAKGTISDTSWGEGNYTLYPASDFFPPKESKQPKEGAPVLTFPRKMLVWNDVDDKEVVEVVLHNESVKCPYLVIEEYLMGQRAWNFYQFAEELPAPEVITIAEAEERLSTPEKPVKVVISFPPKEDGYPSTGLRKD